MLCYVMLCCSWKEIFNTQFTEAEEKEMLYMSSSSNNIINTSNNSTSNSNSNSNSNDINTLTRNVSSSSSSSSSSFSLNQTVIDDDGDKLDQILWSEYTVIYVDIYTTLGDPKDFTNLSPNGTIPNGMERKLDVELKNQLHYLIYRLMPRGATISMNLHVKVTHVLTIDNNDRITIIKVMFYLCITVLNFL